MKPPKKLKEMLRLNAAAAVEKEEVKEEAEEAKKGPIQFPDESFESILTRIARVPKPEKD
jgi:hypothetical protein